MYLTIYVVTSKWFVDRHMHINAVADSIGLDFEFIMEFEKIMTLVFLMGQIRGSVR